MAFVQPKFDPKRSFNRYLNGFQNNPGWVLETLASGMDIKIAGSIMGALLNFALIFGVEVLLIAGWKEAFGWSKYDPRFNEMGFFAWNMTLAGIISIAVIVIGKTAAPRGNKVGFEKFVTLLVAMAPLFLLGPITGGIATIVLLVLGYVALVLYSATTVHRGTEIARMVVFPLGTALFALWLVSLVAGWFSVSQSLPAGATGTLPTYNPAQETAQVVETKQRIQSGAATMTVEWCEQYCTPQAIQKATENARLGLPQDTPVPEGPRSASTPSAPGTNAPTPTRTRTPTPKPTLAQ